ncbi:MAG: hypothetical protein H0T59_02310 [Chloroflexi bacterium]|nr:hypothetical protein [Chloroflexota bacterium]
MLTGNHRIGPREIGPRGIGPRGIGWRGLAVLAISLLAVGGCDILGVSRPTGGAYPDACESLGFAPRQCAAIVARAARDAGVDPGQVASTEILPPPQGPSLGGSAIAQVRFALANDQTRTEDVWCRGVGGDTDLACRADPRIGITSGVDHDIPCTGAAPEGCATLPPTPRPNSVANATPLRIDILDIPLERVGHYRIKVGTATLPDGVLSERSARLADTQPTAFWLEDRVRLDVHPADPNRPPIGNIYRDPFDGDEPVEVFLIFDVTETSPGAVLGIRDLVVR